MLLFALCSQQLGFFFAFYGQRGEIFSFNRRIVFARGPLGSLLFELRQALLHPHPAINDKADFCLQPADFAAGLIQLALRLVDVVASRVMRLANGFQIGLDMANIGHAAFKLIDGFFSISFDLGLVALRIQPL